MLLCVEINNADLLFQQGRSLVRTSGLGVTLRDPGGDVERNASTVMHVTKTRKLTLVFVLMNIMEEEPVRKRKWLCNSKWTLF